MTKQALKALKESIEHWERLAAVSTTERIGPRHCALCRQFNSWKNLSANPDCIDCPVAQRTGKIGCRGTPYDALVDWDRHDVGTPEFIEIAKRELAFLRSLLPPEATGFEEQDKAKESNQSGS